MIYFLHTPWLSRQSKFTYNGLELSIRPKRFFSLKGNSFSSKHNINYYLNNQKMNKHNSQNSQNKKLLNECLINKNESPIINKKANFPPSLFVNETTSILNVLSKKPPLLYASLNNKKVKQHDYDLDVTNNASNVSEEIKGQLELKTLKKKYTSYSKLSEIKLLTIGIASPLRILQWAEKTLPNGKIYGEVLNANTLHHKTFKPQKGGLFCERIFGPLKDFECACGKTDKFAKKQQTESKLLANEKKDTIDQNQQAGLTAKKTSTSLLINKANSKNSENSENSENVGIQITRKFCPDCDVEYTWSVIRRYQLGYIKLSSPTTHIWFLKGSPSYLSLLLDMKKRHLQFVTYCSETLTIEKSTLPFYTRKDSYLGDLLEPTSLFVNENKESTVSVFEKEKTSLNVVNNKKQIKYSKKTKTKHTCLPKKKWLDNMIELNNYHNAHTQITNKKVGEKVAPNTYLARKGTFIVLNLLLSIYYKYPTNFIKNQRTNKNEIPNLKKLMKKLPIDLYILCSVESLLHNTCLSLSIKKGWEILYKRAFFKAYKKAKKTYIEYLGLNKPNLIDSQNSNLILSNGSGSRSGSESGRNNKYSSVRSYFLNYLQNQRKLGLPGVMSTPNSEINELFSSLNQNQKEVEIRNLNENIVHIMNQIDVRFNKLKLNYSNHVLNSLEKTKQPISFFKYTTLFAEKNSIFDIKKTISLEITEYILKNSDYLEKSLVVLLLNSLLLDQFLNIKKTKLNFQSNIDTWGLKLSDMSTTKKNNVDLTSDYLFNNKINVSNNLKLIKKLSLLKTILILKKRNRYKNLNHLPHTETNTINKISKDWHKDKNAFKNNYKKLNLARKNLMTSYEIKESNLFDKKKIYNNVYTLSHRERWEQDKDWYIFSLFTFGVTEYTDYPIFAYKNRLLSLTHLQDYSYQSYQNSPLDSDSLSKTKSTLSSFTSKSNQSTKVKTGSVSASFIHSNSFYSGGGIVQQLLNEFDFNEIQKLDKQNRLLLYQLNKSILKLKKFAQIFVYDKTALVKLKELCKRRDLLIRRTKLVRKIFRKNTSPSSMVLTVIPVLPPDLRPIVKMGSQIAASDLNRLYQRVIYRNERLKKFLKDPATSQSYEMKYAQRLLQEAVDNLMQNGKSGPNSEKDARGRALKSLSDILKGKQGRFRQFLLGKRVDYSGRSVIVVGPKLKLHECGLPLEMAKELYLPFLLKSILNKNYAKTVVGAKTLIQNNPSLANELLREIMQVTPVLLNRAPTLHRLGIQAFVPKLIEGRAILLHPLVCSAFNADFDGDQMAVHVPITIEARAEAWKMMLSRNNLLAPATGEPLAIPSQDMVLGCYYLTTLSNKSKSLRGTGLYFNHLYDVIKLYDQQLIDIHAFVWVKWFDLIENGSDQETPIEIRISPTGQWQEITSHYQKNYDLNHNLMNLYMCTTPGRVLFNLILRGSLSFQNWTF